MLTLPFDFSIGIPISCLLTVGSTPVWHSVLNVKALVGAFNQERALVGAFSVIVQPVVEPMDSFTALIFLLQRCVPVPPEHAQSAHGAARHPQLGQHHLLLLLAPPAPAASRAAWRTQRALPRPRAPRHQRPPPGARPRPAPAHHRPVLAAQLQPGLQQQHGQLSLHPLHPFQQTFPVINFYLES